MTGRKLTDIGDFSYANGELCFDLDDPWVLADASGNVKIQPLDAEPTSYLSPGEFELHFDETGAEFCVEVHDAGYGYPIHLDVGRWIADPDFPPAA